jgi:hypothetical protein
MSIEEQLRAALADVGELQRALEGIKNALFPAAATEVRDGHPIEVSRNAYYNLAGAQYDLERTRKADDTSLNTIRRVMGQLKAASKILDDQFIE